MLYSVHVVVFVSVHVTVCSRVIVWAAQVGGDADVGVHDDEVEGNPPEE